MRTATLGKPVKRMPFRPAPGSVSLLLVMLFYFSTQAFIERLGPEPSTWDDPRQRSSGQMSQMLRSHPAFLPPPALVYDDPRPPIAAARG